MVSLRERGRVSLAAEALPVFMTRTGPPTPGVADHPAFAGPDDLEQELAQPVADPPRQARLRTREGAIRATRRLSQSSRRNLRRFGAASGLLPTSPGLLRNLRDRLSDSAARSRTLFARRAICR